jgi:hypothetical protein
VTTLIQQLPTAGAIRSLSADVRSFSGNAKEMLYEVRSKPVDPSIMLLLPP